MRSTKFAALLAQKEHELEAAVQAAASEAERLGGELKLLRELRKQLASATPRGKGKRGAAAPNPNSEVASTTA